MPGTAAPIALSFSDTAGSTCGALLPTGSAVDVVNGVRVTCIDNGMPVVVMRADDLGRTGYESRDELDADTELKARIEAIRLAAGPMMNLGDVTDKTVPKMILVAPPREGGAISDAFVHPAPLPRHDWRLRRAERGHGVPAARKPGARHGVFHPAGAADADRASDRRQPGAADVEERDGHEEVTEARSSAPRARSSTGTCWCPRAACNEGRLVVSR